MRLVVTIGVLTGFAGCDDATGPASGSGQVEVAAVGDSESSSAAGSEAPTSEESSTAEGTVNFRARVYLRTDTGGWLEVTEQAAHSGSVSASGSGDAETFASAEMGARTYTAVRVVFDEVTANVTGGVTLDLGESLVGEVRVAAGGSTEPAVVEREIALTVSSGASSRIIVDLNADAWLSGADAETRTVSRSEFESAVRIRGDG